MERLTCAPGVLVQCRDGDVLKKMLMLQFKSIAHKAKKVCCSAVLMAMVVKKSQHLQKQISKRSSKLLKNFKIKIMEKL